MPSSSSKRSLPDTALEEPGSALALLTKEESLCRVCSVDGSFVFLFFLIRRLVAALQGKFKKLHPMH